jgi:hypothetical protein
MGENPIDATTPSSTPAIAQTVWGRFTKVDPANRARPPDIQRSHAIHRGLTAAGATRSAAIA